MPRLKLKERHTQRNRQAERHTGNRGTELGSRERRSQTKTQREREKIPQMHRRRCKERRKERQRYNHSKVQRCGDPIREGNGELRRGTAGTKTWRELERQRREHGHRDPEPKRDRNGVIGGQKCTEKL